METRSVSRCIAVAAHGKRCQQSPFRGSPYCWHHTQSRKVWPPSRPAGASARVAAVRRSEADATAAAVAAGTESLRDTGRALTRSLVDGLDEHTLAVLIDFLESNKPGALFLAREGGRIVIGESAAHDEPRAAAG
jgi:hypothetical protein